MNDPLDRMQDGPQDNAIPQDGGAAFPQNDLGTYGMGPANGSQTGMTLRDWFAGQAMRPITKDALKHSFRFDLVKREPEFEVDPDEVAQLAYAFADAMLRERERKEPESDAAYRCRLIDAIDRMNDLDRYAVQTVISEGLDVIGSHVGISRKL
jgi:hypothetical protein